MKILKMQLREYTLTRQSLENQKKLEKFNKPTTQESSSPSGGGMGDLCQRFFTTIVY